MNPRVRDREKIRNEKIFPFPRRPRLLRSSFGFGKREEYEFENLISICKTSILISNSFGLKFAERYQLNETR